MKQISYKNSKNIAYYLYRKLAPNGITPLFFFTKSQGDREGCSPVMEGELPDIYSIKEIETTNMPIIYKPSKDGLRKPKNALEPVKKKARVKKEVTPDTDRRFKTPEHKLQARRVARARRKAERDAAREQGMITNAV